MSTRPTFRHLDSGEVVRVDGNHLTLVHCQTCARTIPAIPLARRGLCRPCNVRAAATLARKLLAASPKPTATMTRFLARLALDDYDCLRVRDLLDAAVLDIRGEECWALPQHQPLGIDGDLFHVELYALLDGWSATS